MKRAHLILIAAAIAATGTLAGCSDQSMPTAPSSSAIAEAAASNNMATSLNSLGAAIPTPMYTFHMGGHVLCQNQTADCPDISEASGGDELIVTGKGTLSTSPTSAFMINGGGTYEERDLAGKVISSGTWKAERLYNFVTYGPVLKGNMLKGQYGGQMEVSASLSGVRGEVVFWVTDAQGTNVPSTAMTGVTAKDPMEEFRKPVGGTTAFVAQTALTEQALSLLPVK